MASAASSASEGQSLADAAVQQVRYFYQRFFQSGDTARPTARERQVALDHVRRLGVEKAEYLVLFALRESRKTGFEIQSYGGIAQYEARALAEMEANAQQRQRALEQRGRESHQRRFLGDYHAYLRQRLTELEADPTEDFNLFQEERRLRQRLDGGAGRIAERFGGEETRLERFRAFLKGRMDQGARVEGVLTFWEWDTQRNPEGLEKA